MSVESLDRSAGGMQRFKTSDGLTLAFKDLGAGPAILCLSGLTRNSNDFAGLAEALPDNRLISMDYRGRGASEFDSDYRNYSVPVEARDVLELLDHLGLDHAAIIGTSRGGIIAMYLAATAKDRLSGVFLNDIGPEVAKPGMDKIMGYLGRNPIYQTHAEAEAAMDRVMVGFHNVPAERWQRECANSWTATDKGLAITYDPKLRDAVAEFLAGPPVDLWPVFQSLAGLPLALLRGENSDLLTRNCAAEMLRQRPDMLISEVPDRGHVPFLDEAESIALLQKFSRRIS